MTFLAIANSSMYCMLSGINLTFGFWVSCPSETGKAYRARKRLQMLCDLASSAKYPEREDQQKIGKAGGLPQGPYWPLM